MTDDPIDPPLVSPQPADPIVAEAPAPVAIAMPGPPGPPGLAGPPVPAGPSPEPAPSIRRLIGASFELLSRSQVEMRLASFYIGAVVLGTCGGLALALWALAVLSVHQTIAEMDVAIAGGLGAWLGLVAFVGGIGLIVASVEGRVMAAAILGGHLTGRPITVRAALARSRATFWRVVIASIIVAIPLGIVQALTSTALQAAGAGASELSTAVTVIVAALASAPFAYLLSGVVLGDVDPFESMRRSFKVFGARKGAAFVVALFESIAQILILLGLGAGLDIALRVLATLGLGTQSGAAGIALTAVVIVVGTFAVGTLVFTVTAISIAPQIVMFVGLTHATMGLDHVRPGGDRDPEVRQAGRRPFRRFTRPMLLGFVLSVGGLVGVVSALPS